MPILALNLAILPYVKCQKPNNYHFQEQVSTGTGLIKAHVSKESLPKYIVIDDLTGVKERKVLIMQEESGLMPVLLDDGKYR